METRSGREHRDLNLGALFENASIV
jgi:hypothetical protein